MRKRIDLTGMLYGRLTVVDFAGMKNGGTCWHVICDCGNEKVVSASRLKSGNTKSCGCIKGRPPTHGMSRTPMYIAWKKMKDRCLSLSNPRYKDYGGRGIRICSRWLDFKNFHKDMGYRPYGMSIERINNNGDYKPGNCKWATSKEQNNNKRNNRIYTYKGIRLNISQWAKRIGISYGALDSRFRDGWTVKEAIGTPRLRIYLGRKKKGHIIKCKN